MWKLRHWTNGISYEYFVEVIMCHYVLQCWNFISKCFQVAFSQTDIQKENYVRYSCILYIIYIVYCSDCMLCSLCYYCSLYLCLKSQFFLFYFFILSLFWLLHVKSSILRTKGKSEREIEVKNGWLKVYIMLVM